MKNKLSISSQNPTVDEIKLFSQDLLKEINKMLKLIGERSSRDINKIKLNIVILIDSLVDKWINIIPFEIINHKNHGKNFIFRGLTGDYLIPAYFWYGRNSLRISLKAYKKWIEDLPSNINWEDFQKNLHRILLDEKIPFFGLTRRHLEILKFYARLVLEYPNFAPKSKVNERKVFFNQYLSMYEKNLTFKQLNKNFNAIIEQYSSYDFLAYPKNWNLDWLLVSPQFDVDFYKEKFPSLPLWYFKGKNETGREFDFAIHKINQNSINNNNHLFGGLINRAYFYWNFNHFTFSEEKGKKSRCKLLLKHPSDHYMHLENQNFILHDTINSEKDIKNLTKENQLVFAPDWQLDLDFSFTKNNLELNKLEKPFELIKNYNLRFVNENISFFNLFESLQPKFIIEQLFKYRIYLTKLPPSTRSVFWIPFTSSYHKSNKNKIITFLMSWLHRGPLFDYNDGILAITYFPIDQINKQFINEIYKFFESINFEIFIYTDEDIIKFSPFSFYYLPESYLFDNESYTWDLPKNLLKPVFNENINFINSIIENEQKR